MKALGILRVEPPASHGRTNSHREVASQRITVDSIFGTHTKSMLMTILSVSVLVASPPVQSGNVCHTVADRSASPAQALPALTGCACRIDRATHRVRSERQRRLVFIVNSLYIARIAATIETPVLRPLVWMGSAKRDLQAFPTGAQKMIGDQLQLI
jgi:uncharacterized MAPEG superfamily protein